MQRRSGRAVGGTSGVISAALFFACGLSVCCEAGEKFGLGCLPEPPGALDGVPRLSLPPPGGAKLGTDALPSSQDNSTSSNFPDIGNQGSQGSCSAWSCTYYYLGFLQRQDKEWTDSADSHLLSPAFTYNQLRADSSGSVVSDYMRFFTRFGACNLSDMPYDDSDDDTQPSESDFRNAAEFRTLGWAVFDAASDAGVTLLKQHLAGGNIAVTTMNVCPQWVFTDADGTENTYNRGSVPSSANVMTGQSGTYEGGHAITVVGYDDNKAYGTGGSDKGAFKRLVIRESALENVLL